ncbi:MAG: TonB-dependent receptor [Bacteroidota bacterium]
MNPTRKYPGAFAPAVHYMRGIALLLAFLAHLTLYAQPVGKARLTGRITDAASGEALIGATVQSGGQYGTTTDLQGRYTLDLPPGEHTISIRLISFAEKQVKLKLEDGENRTLDLALSTSAQELKLVVVSAGRFEQRIEDVTVSMEVIKPAIIENNNSTSMEDAMQFIPGVNIVDGQANIRGGSGWSYGAGSRVQVLCDDLPQLAADANDAKWSFLPVENLEQVEVIKGASSVLFGSSALNGVINIRTAYPKDTPITKINYFAAAYDKAKLSLDGITYRLDWWGSAPRTYSGMNFFHSRKQGRFDLVVGGNMFYDEGYRQGEDEQRARINLNTRYRFAKIEGLSAGVNFNAMKTEGTLFFLWMNDSTGAYRPAPGTLSDYTTYRTNVDPFITYVDTKGNSHKLRTRWFNTTNENNTNQNSTADLYYAEYQYQKRFSDQVTLTGGLLNSSSKVNSELYGNHTARQQAGYLQADLKWKFITLSLGGRVEQNRINDETDDWVPVYRSGINLHVLQETYLRASYGQGYRYPSIAERFVRTNVGALIVYPNEDLTAERGYSSEIGIKQGLKAGSWAGYLDLAAFQNNYDNMMEFCFAQWGTFTDPLAGNGFRSFNVGNTRIRGAEITLVGAGALYRDLRLNVLAGYTYMDPRQLTYDSLYITKVGLENYRGSDSSDFLKYRFKHLVRFDAELVWKAYSLGANVRYNSYMENIDRIFVTGLFDFAFPPGLGIGHYRKFRNKGDTVVDLRAGWQASKHFRASVVVKNVFNYIYMARPADMQPPRVWVLQVGFQF